MTTVTIDSSLRERLYNLDRELQFCDEDGRVLGHFTPAAGSRPSENFEFPHSVEELQRRAEQGGGRPLDQILADLEREARP